MSKIVEPLEFELRRHAKAMDRAFANDPQVTEVSNAIIKFRAGAGGLLTVTDRIGFCPESRGAKFYREAHKALTDFEAEAKLLSSVSLHTIATFCEHTAEMLEDSAELIKRHRTSMERLRDALLRLLEG